MGFTRRTSVAVGVWVALMVCGIHQAVAGGDPPPSPAVPVQPVKADTAVTAPAATSASTSTATEGAAPASTTTGTEGAARMRAVVIKSTPDRNLEDPVLTNDEVKRLLSEGYKQEKMSNGNIQYCRKDDRLGSMVPKKQCTTGAQVKAMAEDKKQFNDLVQQKAGMNPRPSH